LRDCGDGTVRHERERLVLAIPFLVAFAKLLRPGPFAIMQDSRRAPPRRDDDLVFVTQNSRSATKEKGKYLVNP
jgi:hypothetical protein